MITVYGRPDSSAVARVMWTLGELALDHQRIDWGGAHGGNDDADYRAMQPAGKIPAVKFADGSTLWESNAIVRYLCTELGEGRFIPEDALSRAQADAWMDWASNFANAVGRIRKAYKPKDATQQSIDNEIEAVRPHLEILNKQLSNRPFVLGEDMTLADFGLGVWAHRLWRCPDCARPSGLDNIWPWLETLQSRPAYQEHVMDKVSAGPQSMGGG